MSVAAGGLSALWRVAKAPMAVVAAAAWVEGASAQEYCVRCEAPVAVYRCIIENGSPQGITLKAMCIGMMAREGKHATCRVADGTVFDCDGPKRPIDARVAGPLLVKGALAAPVAGTATPQAPPAPVDTSKSPALPGVTPANPPSIEKGVSGKVAPSKAAEDATPKTVEELAKQAGKSTNQMFGKMGDGADKAWRCLSSMFKSC